MMYFLIIAIPLIALILYLHHDLKVTQKKQENKIRESWGNPKNEILNFDLIGRYATICGSNTFHQLSGQTVEDIDFYELFGAIDRTTSKVGQQYLFEKLIHPASSTADLGKLDERADFFAGNPTLRWEIQKELSRLSHLNAYSISRLLEHKLHKRPGWMKYIPISFLITGLLLALSLKYPVLLIALIVPAAFNMLIHYWNKETIFQFSASFPQLNILIDVCRKVSRKHLRFTNNTLDECMATLRPFQRKIGLLGRPDEGGLKNELSQITSYFVELLKAFLLIEVFTLFDLLALVETNRASILFLFVYLGEVDMGLSVASLRAGSMQTCRPSFIPAEKKFSAKKIYHPLINECVKNDIDINLRGVLITGSNMSGKTTFLRTLIINSILAQTIFTCFAEEVKLPILKQFSSIRTDDNLIEGTSYYLEEVKAVAELVKAVNTSHQSLFILDEVFKGTNTIERIAAAKAILSYLNRHNNLVIVSTHDIELSRMLEREYDLYHFEETMEDTVFKFDHKIKRGPLRTRNAIRILEISNYPDEIILEAQRISKLLDTGQANS